ncbi:GCN5-related N-acetyltransferase protein (plasmid) [Rhizobium sp. NXC14]|uniref:GNAT family N-acetyltransferase n=1 Tax=Rhizobium sp. NXC14 TaxID=1981173 RepID=UPI000A205180|nr:GNAT family N-acetyltransferase [Rhizobium sp. NXC14]ARO32671.1 GCN5-related N-acetyltransferase protein [Rhizobium sp. NXC14]
MPVTLETARLYLRPLTTPWDLLRFHSLHTDPFVVNAIYDGKPPSFEDTWAEFKQARADWDTYGIGLFAVFGRDCSSREGRFLGQSGLTFLPESDDLEFSACFHEAASGSEYAPEAGCAILDFAFTTLGAPRVLCFVRSDNRRSLRSVGKMGFWQIGDRWFGDQLTRCFEVKQQDLDGIIAANPRFAPGSLR